MIEIMTMPNVEIYVKQMCKECFKMIDDTLMIQFGEHWICAECKDTYIQKLQEGMLEGDGATTCPYCGGKRDFGWKAYWSSMGIEEYTCIKCDKTSKINMSKFTIHVKAAFAIINIAGFIATVFWISSHVSSDAIQACLFFGSALLLTPIFITIQLIVGKILFRFFSYLTTIDEYVAIMSSKHDETKKIIQG